MNWKDILKEIDPKMKLVEEMDFEKYFDYGSNIAVKIVEPDADFKLAQIIFRPKSGAGVSAILTEHSHYGIQWDLWGHPDIPDGAYLKFNGMDDKSAREDILKLLTGEWKNNE